METLEFIALIASFAIIMVWYLQNAVSGGDGSIGLLALVHDPETAQGQPKASSYRIKQRATRRTHETLIHDLRDNQKKDAGTVERQTTYSTLDEHTRMHRKFRRQDETRYKVKDRKPRGLAPR